MLTDKPEISCIPEGSYRILEHAADACGAHLFVPWTKSNRSILIHPTDDAVAGLKGWIVPVGRITAPGIGRHSKAVFRRLYDLLAYALETEKDVQLVIKAAS